MRVAELFAAPDDVADHPAVVAAARLGPELLEPHAPAADDPRIGVDPAHLAALARAGLLSVRAPAELGGLGADARVDAEVVELLAASCGATWFVITQHDSPAALSRGIPPTLPAGAAEAGPAAARHRRELAEAHRLAGVAIAHLRRPGPPVITATPDGAGGYRLRGNADWCTGWGLIDLVMIAATVDAGGAGERFVFALLPAAPRHGLVAGAPLELSVMGGTSTVALELDDVPVTAEEVLLTVSAPVWRHHDRLATANAKPASVGLLRRALTELERAGERRDAPDAVGLANRLAHRAAPMRARAYDLVARARPGEHLAERVALRGELAALAVHATHALIATRSGSAMRHAAPEQRWAREAAFHLIQAQTPDVRAAQLAAFGRW